MYLFYNLSTTLHVSNDYFIHRQEFINLLYLQLCTNHANVSNSSVLRLEFRVCTVCAELQIQLIYGLLMMNEIVVRNM